MADASCPPESTLARKCQSAILRALASVGQKAVGEAVGKSETWVSRWKTDDLETCARLLAACGLKVVPSRNQCFDPEYVGHLRYFAQIGMSQHQQPRPLDFFDDGE